MGRELTSAVLVFFGAGCGGVLRHLVNRAVPIAVAAQFPLSTFLVNAIGCFAMGALAGWFAFRGGASTQPLRLFLATGVLELMKHAPFLGRRPVFIGDDVTDESVFEIMPGMDGLSFSVGRRAHGVDGHFAAPHDVRMWLTHLLDDSKVHVS